jgi:large subunit ribosomal protein L3
MSLWWLLVKKQEMTKIWNNNQFVPVTIAQIVPQEVVRMKTLEKDGYQAVVVGVGKKELTTKLKGNKISWQRMVEFSTTQTYLPGVHLDWTLLDWLAHVTIEWVSKGKWFQWWIKRHHFAWGPASHGSKFHRALWSTWNRKPRRTNKWHPMAWRMWTDTVTLKRVPLLDTFQQDGQSFVVFKWSLPGAYNQLLKIRL